MPLMTIKASGDLVKPGQYQTTFKGIESQETENGPAIRWIFETDNGQRISGLTDLGPTTKNKPGRWLSALSGKPISDGISVNTDDYIGKRYLVIVQPYKDSSRIETFVALAV